MEREHQSVTQGLKPTRRDGDPARLSDVPLDEREELQLQVAKQRFIEDRARNETILWKNAALAWGMFICGCLVLSATTIGPKFRPRLTENIPDWMLWLPAAIAGGAAVIAVPLMIHSTFTIMRLIWRKARGR